MTMGGEKNKSLDKFMLLLGLEYERHTYFDLGMPKFRAGRDFSVKLYTGTEVLYSAIGLSLRLTDLNRRRI